MRPGPRRAARAPERARRPHLPWRHRMSEIVYTPKHPELYQYDPRFLDEKFVAGDARAILEEQVEQLYMFRLFTPEFCKLLIEEAEHSGKWRTDADVEINPYDAEVKEYDL